MARIFITGSADGLGRLAAQTLLDDGHELVVHARNGERLTALRDLERAGATVVVGNLSDLEQTRNIAGVYLIDPSTWTATILDPAANLFERLGNRLLTYGITTPPRHSNPMTFESGHGLSLYDESGDLLAHLYGHRRFQYIALAPGYGHVIYTGAGAATVALNPHSGRVAYFGPNDELTFNLETGANLGHAKISTVIAPLGPPQLIFRGSAAVGEASFG